MTTSDYKRPPHELESKEGQLALLSSLNASISSFVEELKNKEYVKLDSLGTLFIFLKTLRGQVEEKKSETRALAKTIREEEKKCTYKLISQYITNDSAGFDIHDSLFNEDYRIGLGAGYKRCSNNCNCSGYCCGVHDWCPHYDYIFKEVIKSEDKSWHNVCKYFDSFKKDDGTNTYFLRHPPMRAVSAEEVKERLEDDE